MSLTITTVAFPTPTAPAKIATAPAKVATAPAKKSRRTTSAPSVEKLFYENLKTLGVIATTYKSWQEKPVSFALHKWIVDALKMYVNIKRPTGSTLQTDIRKRVQALADILVEALFQTPVEDAMLDRTWIWSRRIVEDYQDLAFIAVRTPGVTSLPGLDHLYEGPNLLSPIDLKPMELKVHTFARAMMNWLKSLPMHIIGLSSGPVTSPPCPFLSLLPPVGPEAGEQKDEMKEREEGTGGEEYAIALAPVRILTAEEFLRLLTYLKVANSARERIFNAERARETREKDEQFEATVTHLLNEGRLLAEKAAAAQAAFEANIKAEVDILDASYKATTALLEAQIKKLDRENKDNERMLSSQAATISYLSQEVSSLRAASAERKTEIQHIYHQIENEEDGICPFM